MSLCIVKSLLTFSSLCTLFMHLCIQSELVIDNISLFWDIFSLMIMNRVAAGGCVVAVSEEKLFLIPPGRAGVPDYSDATWE